MLDFKITVADMLAADAVLASIVQPVFKAAATDRDAAVCLAAWANDLAFSPDGGEHGEMPSGAEISAFISYMSGARVAAMLTDFALCSATLAARP